MTFSQPAATHFNQSVNQSGNTNLLLVCEHASSYIPDSLNRLGLSKSDALSHRGWDIGAEKLAQALSNQLDAPLVSATYSRLIYDCNRPPEAKTSIVTKSDGIEISGNLDISDDDRQQRIHSIYHPFHQTVSEALDALIAQHGTTRMITIHSFTPVYAGQSREVEVGILHDKDSRIADVILPLAEDAPFVVRRNEPYGPSDNVMHTLAKHGESRGIPHLMIEVANTLIDSADGVKRISDWLAPLIAKALKNLNNLEELSNESQSTES